ncbi:MULTISPECIES: hypothetical protein [Clostridium]|uniref:hypothetical protein n=1 Tax=Clostridium TaxID=1485 RepID=UPI000825BFAD|nr:MULTISPECIES: hypothetical protein [Clostridium]PJI07652.1 hypothetical protein CUB90_07150 [Clostridium sp. CT7]
MKIQVICEHCGKVVELTPQDIGKHSYIYDKLNDNDFSISDIEIDHDLSGDLDDINDLDDIDVDKTLNEIRVNCKNCGDYIILKGFEQF